MISLLRNALRLQAQLAAGGVITSRLAEVTNYDPTDYSVMVRIEPEGILSGKIPLASEWVGQGWGMFCPPSVDNLVEVSFINGDLGSPFVAKRFFTVDERPLPSVPSGEFWLVHESGAFFKLTNDGKCTFSDAHGASVALNGDGTITSAASTWSHTGDVNVTGKVTASSDITSSGGNIAASAGDVSDKKGSMQQIRDVFNEHPHSGVQTGGGVSGTPTVTM